VPGRWTFVLFVAAAVLAAGCEEQRPVGPVGPLGQPLPPPAESPGPAHDVTVPRDGRGEAELDVVSGAASVTVRAADLGADLVRASTPPDAQLVPSLAVDGTAVRVRLMSSGRAGPAEVTVLLDRQVRWRVRLSGGATEEVLDLRGARLAAVDLAAGAARIEVRLPAPRGAVPIRMAGGASDFAVRVPAGVATSVRVGGGAGTVVVDGVRRTGVPGGTTVTSTEAADRYDVDAAAGVSTLVVGRG
jgi:hypothetical protein